MNKQIFQTDPTTEGSVEHEETILERILKFLFEALPTTLTPLTVQMDETKIRKNPPKFMKEHTIKDFRKKHKDESFWARQELVDKLASKYLPETKEGQVRILVKGNEILISYPDELNEAMGEFELNPIAAAERYVAEAVSTAVSPLDREINEEKVIKEPRRYVKPVTASKLKKILDSDPDYFKR